MINNNNATSAAHTSIKWAVYYYHRLKWYLSVQLQWTSISYWCTFNWSVKEGRTAKISVLSVAGKTLSYEFQNAILSIASTQFRILMVIAFVDLKKKKKKKSVWNNGTYERKKVTKNRQQESRNSLECSTAKDSVSRTFFYSVDLFDTPTAPPTLRVLSRADLTEHVRSDKSTAHSTQHYGCRLMLLFL